MNVVHGEWQVVGRRAFRGHTPGEKFAASLDVDQASRAVRRGDIVLLEEFLPTLPGEYQLPEGWDG